MTLLVEYASFQGNYIHDAFEKSKIISITMSDVLVCFTDFAQLMAHLSIILSELKHLCLILTYEYHETECYFISNIGRKPYLQGGIYLGWQWVQFYNQLLVAIIVM